MNIIENITKRKQEKESLAAFIQENKEQYETLIAYYRCAIMEIETKFRVLNEEFSLQYDRNPIENIKSRIKSEESLERKIWKKELPMTLEDIELNISDIAGVRVVCSFPEDIYRLEECLLRQDDITLIKRKDFIKEPKEGGYRSLHLIVEVPIFLQNETRPMKVEVQLRTIAMDFWASLEHKLRYKKDLSEEQASEIAKELLECARISAELDRRMEAIKHRITPVTEEEAHREKHHLPKPGILRNSKRFRNRGSK